MLLDLSQHFLFPLLFITGLIAGTVDAIAGGGGLISLPILLGVGVPPHIALGTNKLQSSIGTLVSTWRYHQQGWISLRTASTGLIFGFIGSAVGAVVGQLVSSAILGKVIPILLFLILAYSLFIPKKWAEDGEPKLREKTFYVLFGFILGFYDGFFGPGVGSFWVFALTFFLGYNLTKATAYTKILNLNTNLAAFACFAIGNHIDYRIGLCMAAGQLIGAQLGAHLAIKKGAAFIRPVFLLVVCGTIMTLLYKNFLAGENNPIKMMLVIIVIISLLGFYWWKEKWNRT